MLNQEFMNYIIETNNTICQDLKKSILEEVKKAKYFIVPEDIYDYDISYHISYDGGNHPEYASTMFSAVEHIEYDYDCDDVCIELEDGTMWLSDLDLNDLIVIGELIVFCKSILQKKDEVLN